MKKMLMIVAVTLLAAIPAEAQSEYPAVEIFGGYSYLSADTSGDEDEDIEILRNPLGNNSTDFHGAGFSIAANFSRWFGIVADFSYNRSHVESPPPPAIPGVDFVLFDFDYRTFFFMFGPRFYARSDRVTAFGHALIGGVRIKVEGGFAGFANPRQSRSQTDFAMGFGGGVDVNLTNSIGARLFQLDYIPVRSSGDWSHNFRAQVGLTFRLGH
jgi:opacity protein-like surface antigen